MVLMKWELCRFLTFKMEFLLKTAEKQRQMYWGIEHVLRIVTWSLKVQVDIILPKLRGQNYLNNL